MDGNGAVAVEEAEAEDIGRDVTRSFETEVDAMWSDALPEITTCSGVIVTWVAISSTDDAIS